MLNSLVILWQIACLVSQVSGLAITREAEQALVSGVATTTAWLPSESFETHTLVAPTERSLSTFDEPAPPAVTEPPSPARLDLVRRQPCCFDERGFRVDCATWTGYYYTWGPQGNPYEGGPQCDGNWNGGSGNSGGSGSGNGQNSNGNGQVAVLNGEGSRLQISLAMGIGLLALAALL